MSGCGVIRKNQTVTPLTTERLDVIGCIHRYNFGWLNTVSTVGDGGGGGGGGGTVVETATVGLAGMNGSFSEVTTQEILPPSFNTPGVGAPGGGVSSFCKTGSKTRAVIRTRGYGGTTMVVLGTVPYSQTENKIYAGAKGAGGGGGGGCGGGGGGGADGGITVVSANGVTTVTTIKG